MLLISLISGFAIHFCGVRISLGRLRLIAKEHHMVTIVQYTIREIQIICKGGKAPNLIAMDSESLNAKSCLEYSRAQRSTTTTTKTTTPQSFWGLSVP